MPVIRLSPRAASQPHPRPVRERRRCRARMETARRPCSLREDALSGPRLEPLRRLLAPCRSRAHGRGRGAHIPRALLPFGNPTEGYSAAPDELAFARCNAVGNPREDAMDPCSVNRLPSPIWSASSATRPVARWTSAFPAATRPAPQHPIRRYRTC